MGTIVDVKSIVEKKKEELKKRVEVLKEKKVFPKLAVILANNEDSSRVYVAKKNKMCEELEVLNEEYILDESVSTKDVLKLVDSLNNDKSVDGILVQLPVYKHLDEDEILARIDNKKDVDGFHPLSLGKLLIGQDTTISCTPKGVITILDSLDYNLAGKHAVVVGRSRIVGKPMAQLLLNRGATVTVCHSKTVDLAKYTKEADVLVVAVGKAHLITADMVKARSIVIDVGINRVDGKLQGDVDTANVVDVASYVTSVPGGVGLTTVVSLLENLVEIAEKRSI